MCRVINVIGSGSNVGKTVLIEGIIKELKIRGFTIATIKHDAHEFDIDKKGKDTYRHRIAGSDTVVISSKNRFAMIKEVEEEIDLYEIIKMIGNKDFIIVEGYKDSDFRKIEVFRDGVSKKIITPKEKLIAIASNSNHEVDNIPVIKKDDYKKLVDVIEKEKNYA